VIPDGPWKQPLVRAVIPCPTAASLADSSQLTLTVRVYFTRYERPLLLDVHHHVVDLDQGVARGGDQQKKRPS
jgi:hypothetical protein